MRVVYWDSEQLREDLDFLEFWLENSRSTKAKLKVLELIDNVPKVLVEKVNRNHPRNAIA